MRCPDCNKFVPFDESDPEMNHVEVEDDGTVRAEVRIANSCGECGTELTEATLEMEGKLEGGGPFTCEHCKDADASMDAEEGSMERISRQGYFKKGQFVPKGGRYGKTFYGASVSVNVNCAGCGENIGEVTMEEYVQASAMDSLV